MMSLAFHHINNIVRYFFTLALFVIVFINAKAQPSLNYTQYMDNPAQINPAYSLTNDYGSITFTAHKQWLGVQGSPASLLFNTDIPLRMDGAKLGIVAYQNSLGVEHVTLFNAFFAKSIQINSTDHLGLSINAGAKYYTTAYAPLDPLDPAIQNDVTQIKPNVGFGVMYYNDDYYIGLSVPELVINTQTKDNTPAVDNNNFRDRYYITGGVASTVNDDVKLRSATMVYISRGVPPTVDLSTKVYFKDVFGVGVNYRNTNEVSALLSFEQDLFHLGYSYQFNASSVNLGTFSNSSHEITLTFLFGKGNRVPVDPFSR